MKSFVIASILAFAAPSMGASVVLKDGKVAADADLIINIDATLNTKLNFRKDGAGDLYKGTTATGTGMITITAAQKGHAVRKNQKKIDPNVQQSIGTLKLEKDRVVLVGQDGQSFPLKAQVKRQGGKVKASVSDQDMSGVVRAIMDTSAFENVVNDPQFVRATMEISGLECAGDDQSLDCEVEISIKAIAAE